MPKRTYTDLPIETRRAMKEPEAKPEPRYAESLLKEAYAMKLLAESTSDPEEKKEAKERERELLAKAQKAPWHPENPKSRSRSRTKSAGGTS